MRIAIMFLSVLMIPLLYLFLGLQIISLGDYVKDGFEDSFHIIFDYTRYREYPDFLKLISLLCLLTILSILWSLTSSGKNGKNRIRHLTRKEKINSSRLASVHEAKKLTQRIEFDSSGKNLEDHTIRGFADLVFDRPKKAWNSIAAALHFKDIHKFNTLRSWKIGDHETHRRGGPPVVTGKNSVWVDASDYNTMIIGVTRAGKTWLIIDILIQMLRMGGESMIVMDVKGELTKLHLQSLINDGYDAYVVDFTNPNRSVHWNPFDIIVRKHREAYRIYLKELMKEEYKKILDEVGTNRILIQRLKKQIEEEGENDELNRQIHTLENEVADLNKKLPKPDYSEAQELATDIAIRLCCEEDSRDPFWPDSASEVLEGYINFLLEERVPDGKGGYRFLPDEMINMRSIKLLHDYGKTRVDPKDHDGCLTLLQYYLTHYRDASDMSVMKLGEYSVMPDNTRGSISSVLSNKIRYFISNERILRMTSRSDFDLKQLGEKKTAIFITVHDEKGTYHKLPSILISQTYQELIKAAREEKALRLKVPVYVVWDEFANGAPWKDIVNALTAGLSRGVRFALAIQDLGQIRKIYGQMASTIWSNCQNTYYLLAGENSTLEEISKMCGNEIVCDENKGCKVKEPVLSPDALRKLSFGQAVIISQRKNPYISWLRPFDSYGFRLPETPDIKEHKLAEPEVFDIREAFKQRRKLEPKKAANFRIDAERIMKTEEERIKAGEEAQVLSHVSKRNNRQSVTKEGDDLGLNEN